MSIRSAPPRCGRGTAYPGRFLAPGSRQCAAPVLPDQAWHSSRRCPRRRTRRAGRRLGQGFPIVRRANGNGIWIDAWRVDGPARRSAVPRRGYDDPTTAPRDFHGSRHRVGPVGKVCARAEGQIDDADVVDSAVREDPLDPTHHRGDPAAPEAAEYPDVDDIGLRSDAYDLAAGAAAIPGDDPRDMCSMSARVACQALIREVDRGENAVRGLDEVRIRCDA